MTKAKFLVIVISIFFLFYTAQDTAQENTIENIKKNNRFLPFSTAMVIVATIAVRQSYNYFLSKLEVTCKLLESDKKYIKKAEKYYTAIYSAYQPYIELATNITMLKDNKEQRMLEIFKLEHLIKELYSSSITKPLKIFSKQIKEETLDENKKYYVMLEKVVHKDAKDQAVYSNLKKLEKELNLVIDIVEHIPYYKKAQL